MLQQPMPRADLVTSHSAWVDHPNNVISPPSTVDGGELMTLFDEAGPIKLYDAYLYCLPCQTVHIAAMPGRATLQNTLVGHTLN